MTNTVIDLCFIYLSIQTEEIFVCFYEIKQYTIWYRNKEAFKIMREYIFNVLDKWG